MKKVIILLIIVVGIYMQGFGQNLDSLWQVYNDKTRADTNRLKAIDAITNNYRENNPDTAIILANQELKLAQQTNQKKYEGKAFNMIGSSFTNKGNYPKGLEYYLKGLKISEEIGFKQSIANCNNNIGIVYLLQSNYDKALEYYLKGLKISEEIGYKNGIGNSSGNIGLVYYNQNDYPKAEVYYLKQLQICIETNNKQGMGNCYNNIGLVYDAQLNYQKALVYYFKSLKLRENIDNKHGVGSCFNNIGVTYDKLGNYALALRYSDSALQIGKEIGDIERQRVAYDNLADVYAKTGKFKEAYESHVKFKALTDSIFNADNSKQLGDMKTNFEVEKKEAELKIKAEAQEAINKEEKQKQQLVIYAVASVLLILMVFSIFLFRRFKITKKQKHIIELQKDEVSRQKHIVEQQKNIVEEHQKEIIDSINYAERIQRSFIATKEILNNNLSDYFVFFKPKDIVSGDFYWASKLNNGNFALATADSTGHGVPGAIMSLLNVTSLEKAVETQVEPSEILNATRKIIIERLKKDGSAEGGKDGMDCSLTVYDFKNKKLVIASAHNPVWIVRGTETIEIKPDKMPVGKHDRQDISFTQQEMDLKTGDVVYTLTDGFPDQFGGEKGKKFMSKNLRELLATNAHLPMHEQRALLETTFTTWVGNLEQVDDVTLIGVRI